MYNPLGSPSFNVSGWSPVTDQLKDIVVGKVIPPTGLKRTLVIMLLFDELVNMIYPDCAFSPSNIPPTPFILKFQLPTTSVVVANVPLGILN